MNKPILNRAASKRGIVFAMILAVMIHLSAIVIASSRHEATATSVITDPPPVIAIDDGEEMPPMEIPVPPVESISPTEFTEAPIPAPVFPRKPVPIRSPSVAHHPTSLRDNFKVLALNAPPPAYPYEARQRRLTGSATVAVTLDPGSGAVVDAELEQSTGSPILDSAALSAFRRWRFKPGMPPKIRIPVTFTLLDARF